jgi:predicted metal-dependent hydrolase
LAAEVESHIVVRRPELRLSEAPRYYLANENPLATHFFNSLNLLFPDGERFFVKSVYDHIGKIADPKLRADTKAFAGQEGQHAREHEAFFRVLESQGYRFEAHLARFRRLNSWCSRNLPAALRLSMTAGAEHYTATLGSLALRSGLLRECHPAMRELITWHAIEEIEHKSVAYDVLRATHPGYFLRVFGFCMATFMIGLMTALGIVLFMKQDRLPRRERARFRAELRNNPHLDLFRKRMPKALRAYFRPGFHPSQVDDGGLIGEHLSSFKFSSETAPVGALSVT